MSMSGISRRTARAHPAILTAVLLISWFLQSVASSMAVPPLARGLLISIPLGAMCFWYWAVFAVARASKPDGKVPQWAWLFAVPPLLVLIVGFAGWSMNNSPAAFVFFVALFVAIWFAAQALENADAPGGPASIGRILGTILLMYFAPIGVWVLRLKIRRVEAKTAA